jgi:hypothetical protein
LALSLIENHRPLLQAAGCWLLEPLVLVSLTPLPAFIDSGLLVSGSVG